MEQAKISEIFLSYQGEGPYIGSRQLFVRFCSCNLDCVYCDTVMESYKSFTKESLLGKILDFEDDYNELAITGGEPLLYAGFLKEFFPLFKKHRDHKIYIETNGTLPDPLMKIIDDVDIIAMDIKLPTATKITDDLWGVHRECLNIAKDKELIVKAVITDSTTMDDIKKMAETVNSASGDFAVILQPVTPTGAGVELPDEEMLAYFKGYMTKNTDKEVRVLGQVHKYIGIR